MPATRYPVLCLNSADTHVLLTRQGEGGESDRLPVRELERYWPLEAHKTGAWLLEVFGVDATYVGYSYAELAEDGRPDEMMLVFQAAASSPASARSMAASVSVADDVREPTEPTPPSRQWIAKATLAATDPLGASALRRYAEADDLAPWSDPNWYEHARVWCAAQLGFPCTLHPFYAASITCVVEVVRQGTKEVVAYLKASLPWTCDEASVIRSLAELAPEMLPSVVAADPERRWMLMRPMAGVDLADTAGEENAFGRWLETVRIYGALQNEAAGSVGLCARLRASGCPVLSTSTLIERARALATCEQWLHIGHERGLTEKRARQLRNALEADVVHLDTLIALGIPDTIDHGDLHDSNVRYNRDAEAGRTLVIFDWTDCAWAHPFLSVIHWFLPFLNGAKRSRDEGRFAGETRQFEQLRDAYLSTFEGARERVGSPALVAAFDDAMILGWLHIALGFARFVHAMPAHTRWEYQYVIPLAFNRYLDARIAAGW